MNLGPAEIGLIVLAVMLLFGYKKLPDASRSLGRSLRIFKGEVGQLREGTTTSTGDQDDDAGTLKGATSSAPGTVGRPADAPAV
jgi:sec-independent protein translocase protein TatA